MLCKVVFVSIVVADLLEIACDIVFMVVCALVIAGFSDFCVIWYVLVVVGELVVVGILIVFGLIAKEFELLCIQTRISFNI